MFTVGSNSLIHDGDASTSDDDIRPRNDDECTARTEHAAIVASQTQAKKLTWAEPVSDDTD